MNDKMVQQEDNKWMDVSGVLAQATEPVNVCQLTVPVTV